MNSSGIRMRRRSGWPLNRMPNMSKTSRSIQSAPGQSGTAEGSAGSGSSTPRLDDQALGGVEVSQHVVDLEPGAGPAGIAQVVGRSQLGEQIEAALALEQAQAALSSRDGGTNSRRLSRNRDVREDAIAQGPRQGGQGRGVGIG